MRRIKEKLKSQSGASILLALLFFLLCTMVGASVLMAAASNAGKSRSNRQEQQKYLTLSSAMQLVCDELTGATYTAKFVEEEPIRHTRQKKTTDEQGKEIIEEVLVYVEHPYEQSQGDYSNGFSQNVLPLKEALDGLVAKQLPTTIYVGGDGEEPDQHIFKTDILMKTEDQKFEMTLTVTEPADRGGLDLPVKVTVVLTPNYRMYLTAALASEESYAMYAELVGKPESLEFKAGVTAYEIKWTLSQITKQEGVH